MDELKTRLKNDAEQIAIGDSASLQKRIEASLEAERRIPQVGDTTNTRTSLWLASSLTGLVAAALLIAVLNWQDVRTKDADSVGEPARTVDAPTQSFDWSIGDPMVLNVQSADLTRSLEEELANLQADFEKAKENVRKDLDFTF